MTVLYAIAGYLGLVAVMSCAAAGTYWFDKRCATAGTRRVPEKTLHAMSLLGGWPGALWAQKKFRHKTIKTSFRVTFWATVAAHFVIVSLLMFGVVDLTIFEQILRSR